MGGLTALSYCGSAACCCGSAAISCCSNRCSSKNSTVTRIAYATILLLVSICAWVCLSPGLDSQFHKMEKYTGNPCSSGWTTEQCDHVWGQLGVYRVMFASTVFFGLMSVMMIGVKSSRDKRAGIQNGFWGPKLLIFIAVAVGAFFIKNSFFHGAWGYIGLVGGFVFLVVQLILLIDFAHAWADSWVGKMEEGSGCHKWLIVLCSLGLYIVSFVVTVLMYVYYTKSETSNCNDNKFFISFNLILAIVMTAASISGKVQEAQPNSGLLQSGVVVAYCTYLTWSAISETHAGQCQPNSMNTNDTATTIVGAMFTFIAVAYSSMRTSSASQIGSLGMNDKENAKTDTESDKLVGDDEDLETGDDDDDETPRRGGKTRDNEMGAVLYNWCFFHLTFACASLYLMMVLTDWGVMSDRSDIPSFHVGRGKASTWVKVVSSWLSAILFIWSLVAPICMSNRDFN